MKHYSEKRKAVKDLLSGREKITSFSLGYYVDDSKFNLEEFDYLIFVFLQSNRLPHEEQILHRVINRMKTDRDLWKLSETQLDEEIEGLRAATGPFRDFTPQESLTLSQTILTKVQR